MARMKKDTDLGKSQSLGICLEGAKWSIDGDLLVAER
jgi:hypothetical protein